MYAIYGLPFAINIPQMLASIYHTTGSYGLGIQQMTKGNRDHLMKITIDESPWIKSSVCP